MISLDWLELEALARDIANLEDRLRAARSTKHHELTRLLEGQLEQAKSRRPQLMEAITRHMAPAPARTTPGAWHQLTPSDIAQARRELDRRRAEILARHAEELKALAAERDEIDVLDRAIEAFARKFTARPQAGEVVRLDEERGLRAYGQS